MPGQRDRHTGCVGAYLVEHDLFDFLLFSLPDNDTHSHKAGPDGQVRSIAEADRALERIVHVAGGVEAFLERARGDRHVGPLADDGRGARQPRRRLRRRARAPALRPGADRGGAGGVAVGALGDGLRARREPPRRAGRRRGGDRCAASRAWTWWRPRENGEAVVHSRRGELRFAPGGELADRRGRGWSVEGERGATLDLRRATTYPDALDRLWSALECPHSGDVLASAEPGYEFVDWGGADHVGGGSHGSLHRDDSEGVLLLCGVDAPEQARVGADRRHRTGARALRCTVDAMTEELDLVVTRGPHPVHVRVRAGLRKSQNWRQLAKFCIVGGSGYVVNLCVFALVCRGPRRAPPGRGDGRLRRRRDQQLLVEPPLDLPRAGPAAPGPRRRASSRSAWWRSCSRWACSSCW